MTKGVKVVDQQVGRSVVMFDPDEVWNEYVKSLQHRISKVEDIEDTGLTEKDLEELLAEAEAAGIYGDEYDGNADEEE